MACLAKAKGDTTLIKQTEENSLIFKVASMDDLEKVKSLFYLVVQHMRKNGLLFWNEYYPLEVIKEDIEQNQLYLLCKENTPLCACAVFPAEKPFEGVCWW